MKPSDIRRLEQEREARIARGLAEIEAANERARQEHLRVERLREERLSETPAEEAQTIPPQNGSSPKLEQSAPESSGRNEWDSIQKVPARRGIHPGGERRISAPWFAPLARACADGTQTKVAAARLGLSLSQRDILRLYQLAEFNQLRRAYRRLYRSEFWGKPNSERALARLLEQEDRKPIRTPKPKNARYISHPLRKLV